MWTIVKCHTSFKRMYGGGGGGFTKVYLDNQPNERSFFIKLAPAIIRELTRARSYDAGSLLILNVSRRFCQIFLFNCKNSKSYERYLI